MTDRKAIFVVGMGRSGTSALARVLAFGGAALPARLMAPNHGNPIGYWEPQAAVDLNDDFLSDYHSSWYNPALPVRKPGAVTPAAGSRFIGQAAAVIQKEFGDAKLIVLKDPRIAGLLPYWIAASMQLGYVPVATHIFRHPDEVAASLARRDGLDRSHSHALWVKYNLFAERDSRQLLRVFCSFDELLGDWRTLVQRISQCCEVPLSYDRNADGAADKFLQEQLRHHVESAAPAGGPADLLGPVYDCLRGAIDCGRINETVMDDAFDRYCLWVEETWDSRSDE